MNKITQHCPDPSTLADWIEGAVSDEMAETVMEHVGECQTCSEWLERAEAEPRSLIAMLRAGISLDNLNDTVDDRFARNRSPLQPRPPHELPTNIGEFRIVRELGRGGMGVVYEAEQTALGRHVALKVLPPHSFQDENRVRRFEREVQAAARLHHTNIVPVFGAGRDGDLHFYAMQYIQGRGLDRVIADARVQRTPFDWSHQRFVAEMGAQVASALHHAHAYGVEHRDIKPANLILDAHGIVWVADFGLAKLDDGLELTGTGNLLGTLRFMPPESFQGYSDPRSDVYSLGITLYELLTLTPAFAANDQRQLVHDITKSGPPPLTQVIDGVSRDLATIIHKAIAQDPQDRYQNAAELEQDLRSFVNNEPILARPAGALERLCRSARRNPVVASLTASVFLALVMGTIVSNYYAVAATQSASKEKAASEQARESEQSAKNSELLAKKSEEYAKQREVEAVTQLGKTQIALAEASYLAGNGRRAIQYLQACPEHLRDQDWEYLSARADRTIYTHPGDTVGQLSGIHFVPPSRNRVILVPWKSPDPIRCIDSRTGKVVQSKQLEVNLDLVHSVVSPDGKLLAISPRHRSRVCLYNASTFEKLLDVPTELLRPSGTFDSQLLFAADSKTLILQKAKGTLALDTENSELRVLSDQFFACATAHTKSIAYGVKNKRLTAVDIETGETIWTGPLSSSKIQSMAVCYDDSMLAIAGWDEPSITLHDAADGRLINRLASDVLAPETAILPAAHAPFFATIEKSSGQNAVKVWKFDDENQRPAYTTFCRDDRDRRVGWNDTSGILVSGFIGVDAYPTPAVSATRLLAANDAPSALFLEDGVIAACLAGRQGMSVFEIGKHDSPRLFKEVYNHVATSYCRDKFIGTRSEYGGTHNVSDLINIETDSFSKCATMFWRMRHIAVAPGGRYVAAAHPNKFSIKREQAAGSYAEVLCRDINSFLDGKKSNVTFMFPAGQVPTILISTLFERDGELATKTSLHNLVTGRLMIEKLEPSLLRVFCLSPSGEVFATGCDDGKVRLYDARTLELLSVARLHDKNVTALAFRCDGAQLATGESNGQIRLWQIADNHCSQCVHEIVGNGVKVRALDFNPSGTKLLALAGSELSIWDLSNQPISTKQVEQERVNAYLEIDDAQHSSRPEQSLQDESRN
ncbi:WD40 repeat domain-containing serine/threonine-protein kinase [Neorhodopirellula pilleata]|uniref:Serine/threonine-protein kinase PrkC n=1 Tax=Neorhodopirellula pilleata TaxID=2714738 RepID=A0A5C6A2L8_9BACT|nr:WD40 repeat domain-containing serine/threonine-protein kinase [Neorhodopirellula pilleata]TWT94144.1 Serine/threonine-protein kinase PrkC [Neorhodopirellula pilleata]